MGRHYGEGAALTVEVFLLVLEQSAELGVVQSVLLGALESLNECLNVECQFKLIFDGADECVLTDIAHFV